MFLFAWRKVGLTFLTASNYCGSLKRLFFFPTYQFNILQVHGICWRKSNGDLPINLIIIFIKIHRILEAFLELPEHEKINLTRDFGFLDLLSVKFHLFLTAIDKVEQPLQWCCSCGSSWYTLCKDKRNCPKIALKNVKIAVLDPNVILSSSIFFSSLLTFSPLSFSSRPF